MPHSPDTTALQDIMKPSQSEQRQRIAEALQGVLRPGDTFTVAFDGNRVDVIPEEDDEFAIDDTHPEI